MHVRSTAVIAIVLGAAAAIISAAVIFYLPASSIIGPPGTHSSPPLTGAKQGNVTGNVTKSESISSPTAGYHKVNVTINGYALVADIADTPDRMALGLDVRDSMNESQAMLFPFTTEAPQGFWMKGMKFPIDIIWINKDKQVVHIEPSLAPCTPFTCPTYTPSQPAMYVLETVSGFAAEHNVKEGTVVQFDMSKQFS